MKQILFFFTLLIISFKIQSQSIGEYKSAMDRAYTEAKKINQYLNTMANSRSKDRKATAANDLENRAARVRDLLLAAQKKIPVIKNPSDYQKYNVDARYSTMQRYITNGLDEISIIRKKSTAFRRASSRWGSIYYSIENAHNRFNENYKSFNKYIMDVASAQNALDLDKSMNRIKKSNNEKENQRNAQYKKKGADLKNDSKGESKVTVISSSLNAEEIKKRMNVLLKKYSSKRSLDVQNKSVTIYYTLNSWIHFNMEDVDFSKSIVTYNSNKKNSTFYVNIMNDEKKITHSFGSDSFRVGTIFKKNSDAEEFRSLLIQLADKN